MLQRSTDCPARTAALFVLQLHADPLSLFSLLPEELVKLHICNRVYRTRNERVWKRQPEHPVFALLAAGGSVSAPVDREVASSRDRHGRTPLMVALTLGKQAAAVTLARYTPPSSLNIRESCGRQWTALHYAATSDSFLEVAALLLRRGANATLLDSAGFTPEILALNKGAHKAHKALLGHVVSELSFSLDLFPLYRPAFKSESVSLLLVLARMCVRMPKDVKRLVLGQLYTMHLKEQRAAAASPFRAKRA